MSERSILVVEDEFIVAEHIARIMERFDYRILALVDSVGAAMREIERRMPGLVFVDINLRGERDGIDLARALLNKAPVVFLTAYADTATLERAKLAEPYGYITKPFHDAELHSTAEMAIYKFRMERAVKNAHATLETTLGSLREGVITVAGDGSVTYMNPAMIAFLEMDCDTNPRIDCIAERFRAENGNAWPALLEGGEDCVLRLSARGGAYSAYPFEVGLRVVDRAANAPVGRVIIFRSMRDEFVAHEYRSRLSSLLSTTDDAVFSTDGSGLISDCNPGASLMFGYESRELLGRPFSLLIPTFRPDGLSAVIDGVIRARKAVQHETMMACKDGRLLVVSLAVSPLCDPAGEVSGVLIIARDMTARRCLEREVLCICERERRRMGQDLHDTLGQDLTAILLRMRAHMEQGPEAGEMKITESLLEQAIARTRTLAKNLVPITLEHQGLTGALQELADYVESVHGFSPALRMDAVHMESETAIQLYRIAQEAVSNACKHSKSTEVEIRLSSDEAEIVLSVRDHGRGLPAVRGSSGLGLSIMAYRAAIIGAHLEVFGHPGGGTAVVCRVPLEER